MLLLDRANLHMSVRWLAAIPENRLTWSQSMPVTTLESGLFYLIPTCQLLLYPGSSCCHLSVDPELFKILVGSSHICSTWEDYEGTGYYRSIGNLITNLNIGYLKCKEEGICFPLILHDLLSFRSEIMPIIYVSNM